MNLRNGSTLRIFWIDCRSACCCSILRIAERTSCRVVEWKSRASSREIEVLNLSKASFTSVVTFPSWSAYIQLGNTDENYMFGVCLLFDRFSTLGRVRKEQGEEPSHFEGEAVWRSRRKPCESAPQLKRLGMGAVLPICGDTSI